MRTRDAGTASELVRVWRGRRKDLLNRVRQLGGQGESGRPQRHLTTPAAVYETCANELESLVAAQRKDAKP